MYEWAKETDKRVVFVIDEAHYLMNDAASLGFLETAVRLVDKSVLYDLHQTRGITMILIANREQDLFSNIDTRIASRLRARTRIQFDYYRDDELMSILNDRARWGLREEAVGREQIKRIARASGGDARVAIGILRTAAQRATDRGDVSITDAVIRESVPEAEAEIRQKNIEQLTEDQRLIYEILSEHDELASGDLYELYEARASDPKTKRMVRNYLQKMAHYNLVVADGEARGRTYRVVSPAASAS
ncbi:Cdc6/Cdc18 family protein [Halobium salinum]|uniref:Cdc6/Cdc18 family protein n=1 Tax=Halobium salinum TaxID=1364940 RepID=A0ABD5PHZ6_9EURY|nr:hypothetical protein [Halobium salinum]